MKKIIFLSALCFVLALCLSSCANSKKFDTPTSTFVANPYGPADETAQKNDQVVYQVSAGNVVCSIIFCETVVVPIWLIGWDLYEPVRLKTPAEQKKS